MATSNSKKRKITDEKRVFQDKWTELYFFTSVKDKPVCLICNESVSVIKEFNIKRHYDTKHATKFGALSGQLRADRLNELKRQLDKQHSVFKKQNTESESLVKASYVISEKIARAGKPFVEGEFIKECFVSVAEILCPQQKKVFEKISLSAPTVTRRIEDLGEEYEKCLKEKAEQFVYYSIAFDESTDISDTAQLAIFIRGIDDAFNITEELASLFPMKGTTKGLDIFEACDSTLNRIGLKLNNLSGVVTDGAPAMLGKKEGAVAHLRKKAQSVGNDDFFQYHCFLHVENLCAKIIIFKNVMCDVVKTVNFIRAHGLNHREFKEFLVEVGAEYSDVPYFTEVRWLSRGIVLKRVFDLKHEIERFMEMKGKMVDFFADKEWMSDFAFLTDITTHLNELNLKLQGKQNFVHELLQHVRAFETKLRLWEFQLEKRDFSHFPSMSTCSIKETKKYVDMIVSLKSEFNDRFNEIKTNEISLKIFSMPWGVNVEMVPSHLQLELIELQTNTNLEDAFKKTNLLEFYSKYISADKFPELRKHALKMLSLFGTTYRCEQMFSNMKNVKSKPRNRLTDEHLENVLRISGSDLTIDIDNLVKEKRNQAN